MRFDELKMNNFFKRYGQLIGKDVKNLEALRYGQIPKSLRVNTLKIDEKTIVRRLRDEKVELKKIHFLKNGYYYNAKFSLGSTPEYLLGYYYLQEAAAQIPAEVLAPTNKDIVLDMASSPGGKTTQIAGLMKNEGAIIALDINNRIDALKNNIERLGVRNCIVYDKDAHHLDFDIEFDRILLDAPCSGNFLIDKEWFSKRSVQQFEKMSVLQKELIKSGIGKLKKGGVLVYSTCSLEPEENEFVIDYALRNFDVKLEKIEIPIGEEGITEAFGKKLNSEIKLCKRFWPHKTGTEGFFVAKMRKM